MKSWSYGENNYARVEGDHIIHNGHAVSPNQFAQSFARSTRNAWQDLFIRRPGDKNFKIACRLRDELAAAAKAAAPALATRPAPEAMSIPTAAPPMPATSTATLPATPPSLPTAAPPRNTDPEPGWDLPERRKFRYRLEDVAY
ncbi:hypothetical protein [Rugamonas aquatica]|uniref:hypothetical protein n=1 Tax=Rugamonas aquatica TaxID=2743357 RepID=UPI001F39B6A7|nr:hypothetical protein [Rugamonas aquatica]